MYLVTFHHCSACGIHCCLGDSFGIYSSFNWSLPAGQRGERTYLTPGLFGGKGDTSLGSRFGEWDCRGFTSFGSKWRDLVSSCAGLSRSPFLPGRPFSPSDGAAASRWTRTEACPPCRRGACCVHRSSSPSASPAGERARRVRSAREEKTSARREKREGGRRVNNKHSAWLRARDKDFYLNVHGQIEGLEN